MAAPFYGQVRTSGSAQQIDPTSAAGSCVAFVIRAPLTNAGSVFLGDVSVTTTSGHQLDPGDEYTYEHQPFNSGVLYQSRPSDFWVWIVTANDKITWLALP